MKKILTHSILALLLVTSIPQTVIARSEQTETTIKKKKKSFKQSIKDWVKPIKDYFFKKEKKQDKKESATLAEHSSSNSPNTQHPNVNEVISTMQAAAIAGPSIYTKLISDSIETVLHDAEKFLVSMTWGKQTSLVQHLEEKMRREPGKASLLLQIKIAQIYLDSSVPLAAFIRDLTIEEIELKRYELAILELSSQKWMKSNPTVKSQIENMLKRILETKVVLDQIDHFSKTLLSYLFEPLDPPKLFRPRENSLIRSFTLEENNNVVTREVKVENDECGN